MQSNSKLQPDTLSDIKKIEEKLYEGLGVPAEYILGHPQRNACKVFDKYTDEELSEVLSLAWTYKKPYVLCEWFLKDTQQYYKDLDNGRLMNYLRGRENFNDGDRYPLSTVVGLFALELPFDDIPLWIEHKSHTLHKVLVKRLEWGK